MIHLGLFEGIGGFSLAARQMGWHTEAVVEIDPFCQELLAKNFPESHLFDDIKNFTYETYSQKSRSGIDIISGGFPCQPYSLAGKRKGSNDDRALWPEMLRVIDEFRPTWVVGENVGGFVSMDEPTSIIEMEDQTHQYVWFEKVAGKIIRDLRSIGYELPTTNDGTPIVFVIPACAVGAIHRRDRVWIIAKNANGIRRDQSFREKQPETGGQRIVSSGDERGVYLQPISAYAMRTGCEKLNTPKIANDSPSGIRRNNTFSTASFGSVTWNPDTSEILREAYGVPGRMDRRNARIKALGNAIVPQVAYQIFKIIQDYDRQMMSNCH